MKVNGLYVPDIDIATIKEKGDYLVVSCRFYQLRVGASVALTKRGRWRNQHNLNEIPTQLAANLENSVITENFSTEFI